MPTPLHEGHGRSTGLVEVLDRVLDKGLVVAGDISISLANVELLTIRIRLLVCSIDKAEQIGLNWWRYDRNLVAPGAASSQVQALEERIAALEGRSAPSGTAAKKTARKSARPQQRNS